MNPILAKNFLAAGAIPPGRIVKHGASEGLATLAAAASDASFGISDALLGADDGYRIDIIVSGIAQVELGGTVSAGDPITSDATGRGIKAAPASGAKARVIGFAWSAGVSGDLCELQIAPGLVQG